MNDQAMHGLLNPYTRLFRIRSVQGFRGGLGWSSGLETGTRTVRKMRLEYRLKRQESLLRLHYFRMRNGAYGQRQCLSGVCRLFEERKV